MVIFIRLLLYELNQHVLADPSQEEMKMYYETSKVKG